MKSIAILFHLIEFLRVIVDVKIIYNWINSEHPIEFIFEVTTTLNLSIQLFQLNMVAWIVYLILIFPLIIQNKHKSDHTLNHWQCPTKTICPLYISIHKKKQYVFRNHCSYYVSNSCIFWRNKCVKWLANLKIQTVAYVIFYVILVFSFYY